MKKQILSLCTFGVLVGGIGDARDIDPNRSILYLNEAYNQQIEEAFGDLTVLSSLGSYQDKVELNTNWELDGFLQLSYPEFSKGGFEASFVDVSDEAGNIQSDFAAKGISYTQTGAKSFEGFAEGSILLNGADSFFKFNLLKYAQGETETHIAEALVGKWLKDDLSGFDSGSSVLEEVDFHSIGALTDFLEGVFVHEKLFGVMNPIQTINSPYGVETHVPLTISNETLLKIGRSLDDFLVIPEFSFASEMASENLRIEGNFIFTETKNPFLDLMVFSGDKKIERRLIISFEEDGLIVEVSDFYEGLPVRMIITDEFFSISVEDEWNFEMSATDAEFDASFEANTKGLGLKEMVGVYMEKGAGDSWSGVLIFPHFLTGTSALVVDIQEYVATIDKSVLELNIPIDGMADIDFSLKGDRTFVDVPTLQSPVDFVNISEINSFWR